MNTGTPSASAVGCFGTSTEHMIPAEGIFAQGAQDEKSQIVNMHCNEEVASVTSVCDRNCFDCKYDDCICDDLTYEDYKAEKILDRLAGVKDQTAAQKKAAYNKQYYEKNKERITAYRKQRREENKEQMVARRRHYYERNKEQALARQKQYYEKRKVNNHES